MNLIRVLCMSVVAIAIQFTDGREATAQPSKAQSGTGNIEVDSITSEDVLGNTPWFNSGNGELIPVAVRERFDDSVNRHSRWLPQAKKLKKPKPVAANPAAGKTGGGTGLMGTDMSLGNLLGWLLLFGIFFSIIGLLVYTLTKAEIDLSAKKASSGNTLGELPDEQLIERMKHLPAELRRTDVNLRTEAQRLMDSGQFDQAVILLFGHQLLMLDKAGLLRLTRGKTNGRYVRETRSADRESGDCLRMTATAFERSYFGRHQLTRIEFAELWSNNQRIENRVDLLQEVAA